AGIYEQPGWQFVRVQHLVHPLHASRVIVCGIASTAQNDVAVLVPAGGNDAGQTLLGHTEDGVRLSRGADRVDCNLDVTAGAILEPPGHRQSGCELPMDLAFGGARANSSARHRVREELWGDRIEEFAAGG